MAESVFAFFTGSHDANISVTTGNDDIYTIELERIFGNRYFCFTGLIEEEDYKPLCEYIHKILKQRGVNLNSFDVGIFEWYTPQPIIDFMVDFFSISTVHIKDDFCHHHRSHAANAFYSSGFDEALVVSNDGFGDDGTFCVYEVSKSNPNFNQINEHTMHTYPTKYANCGRFISEIKKNAGPVLNNLANAGKIMGLSAYGSFNKDYYERINRYFRSEGDSGIEEITPEFLQEFSSFDTDCLKDKESYDFAYCSQLVFEECFFEKFYKFFNEDKHKNVCLTGGGALNVVANEKLSKKHPNTNFFVPSSPGDSGLSYGMIAGYLKDSIVPEVMYAGCEILDEGSLSFILDQRAWLIAEPELIARELSLGKIIGVCRGGSETGPRALGNRTILADPRSHKAKDDINSKVKFREWYRPFAPVCKEDKANKYFESSSNACYKYMSFSPNVREEYRKLLPSVTHIDGSSRLQTVNREQNDYIYDILDSFEQITGIPILINTSFNTRGKAILTRYLEAIKVLDSTELDGVVLDNYYICK